jgi:hypothetical protein
MFLALPLNVGIVGCDAATSDFYGEPPRRIDAESSDTAAEGGSPSDVECVPGTCSDLNAQCGEPPDGCGSKLECGACGKGASCDGSLRCVAIPEGEEGSSNGASPATGDSDGAGGDGGEGEGEGEGEGGKGDNDGDDDDGDDDD